MTSEDVRLEQGDKILVTGRSCGGDRYVRLRGVVATVSPARPENDEEAAFKLWPCDEQETPLPEEIRYYGKIWFYFSGVEEIVVLAEAE